MTIPNVLSSLRLVLSPIFFIVYFAPVWFGLPLEIAIGVLWFLGIIIEVSDALDGHLARKLDQVSDTGKLLDPYSDVISRCTYFLCFSFSGIMPIWIFLIIFYRELSIAFVRLVMLKRGVVMAARWSGKLKASSYTLAGVVGMAAYTVRGLASASRVNTIFRWAAFGIFVLAALLAVISFTDYLRILRKSRPGNGEKEK
ncbi:MAG: CDP-diacylglycerol--glycerol-3-phosphate 3-phosphatidyltransferase [Spirochaetia bacterium]